ncbi:helix-turn-helix domain-containing protein [Mucisphaera sp.]|uniref:helix-turn-helix domain-containing protein n=1 Tax=Mucisphaera sp. TaxID=2913024 RepID=UPI003D0E7F73
MSAAGTESSRERFGELVRRLRRRRGLTLDALAERCGVTKGYLSLIENERVGTPSDEVVNGLAAGLGVSDGSLHRAADWATTPDAIRREVDRLRAGWAVSQRLARRLRSGAGESEPGTGDDLGGACFVDLDAMYRSGELGEARHADGVAEAGGEAADRDETLRLLAEAMGSRVPVINRVPAGYPAAFTDLDFPARVADEYVHCPDLRDRDAFAARVVGDSMEPAYREGDVVVFSPEADVVDGCDCFVRLEPDHDTTFKRVFFDEGGKLVRLQPLNAAYPPRVVEREGVAGLYRAVWRMTRL